MWGLRMPYRALNGCSPKMDSPPKLFALPPGVDFVKELAREVDHLLDGDPIKALNAEIWVNTARTRRKLVEFYQSNGARLIPRIRLITELSALAMGEFPAKTVSALQRQLDLMPLVGKLVELQPDLVGRISISILTESLDALLEELADQAVDPSTFESLDVDDASGHWARLLEFVKIRKHLSLGT